MAKKDNGLIVIGIIALVVIALVVGPKLGLFSITGNEQVTRSMPSTVQPGGTFTVTYNAVGTSGSYGVSILDEISGGCKFSDGTSTLKYVLLSPATSQSFTVTSPQTGSCIFVGDAKFGTESVKNMATSSITVSTSGGNGNDECSSGQTKCESTTYFTCSSGEWDSQGQVNGKCGYTSGSSSGSQCTSGQTKCESTSYYTCSNGYWSPQGEVNGYCGYSSSSDNGSQSTDEIFDWIKSNWILLVGGFVGLIILKSLLSK